MYLPRPSPPSPAGTSPAASWTAAREGLDITVLVFSNRSYRILQGELRNVGVQNPGPRAVDMLSLDRPALDWVALARGHGVEAEKVADTRGLDAALGRGLDAEGPYLIELEM